MNIDEDFILELAPDEKAFKASGEFASVDKWESFGKVPERSYMWGVFKGNEGTYDVHVITDWDGSVFSCSCLSGERPCKHAMGLALMICRGVEIPDAPMPSGHDASSTADPYNAHWE